MSDLRLVFTRIKSADDDSTTPPADDHTIATPTKTENQTDEQTGKEQSAPRPGTTWAFSANLDMLALRYGQADAVIGFYDAMHELFVALRICEEPGLTESSFRVWADGSPTMKKVEGTTQPTRFWLFYISLDELLPRLEHFIKDFLKTEIGWTETGQASQLPREALPFFDYDNGELSTFFATLQHPNGQTSTGYPDIFYSGNEAVLGFGRIAGKPKTVTLGDGVSNPLSFKVRTMDEILPDCVIKVDKDLPPIHACGYTEDELIEHTEWEYLTEDDKTLLRTYGPPRPLEPDESKDTDDEASTISEDDFDRTLFDDAEHAFRANHRIKPLPLNEINREGFRSVGTVNIDHDGRLVFEGQDLGEEVERQRGRDEYEYKLIVEPWCKDLILINLIKEHFTSEIEFRKWLKKKNVPSQFLSYP